MANGNGKKKGWEEYLLWALALLGVGAAGYFIYTEEKKKKTAALPPPATKPSGLPAPPPAQPPQVPIPTPGNVPFGSGGAVASNIPTTFDTLMQQAVTQVPSVQTAPSVQTYTIVTQTDPLRAHTQPGVDQPVAGSYAHGAQVASVGEPAQVSADGRHWLHVMGVDAQTGVPLLGWVDMQYIHSGT